MNLRWILMLGIAAALSLPSAHLHADDAVAKKPAQKSVDDALLEDLDNELLEGVGKIKPKPADEKPEVVGEEMPLDQPEEGEDIGMPSPDEDPLGYISQEMRRVERMIPKRANKAHAEAVQQQIVENLAKLIEQAQKQQAQQSSSQQKKKQQQQANKRQSPQQSKPSQGQADKDSNKPAADSTTRLSKQETVRPDAETVRGLLKDAWGHLPERQREQMLQTTPEQFLPQYELMIERYYRRLAEEQAR